MNPFSRLKSAYVAARAAFSGQPTAGLVDSGDALWFGRSSSWSADTIAGETVTDTSILTSTTCYACSKVLGEVVASLPGSIMRQLKRKKREEMESHPALTLLCEMPNPEMNAYTFLEMAVHRTINTGNFYCEIQRDGRDRPIGLWPIHPTRVRPVRWPDGSLYWKVHGDYHGSAEYSDPTHRDGETLVHIPNRDMLNIVGPGSQNGIIGPGIAPGVNEIGIDLAVRRYGAEFFKSGGAPLGFMSHPAYIADPGKREQFRRDINAIKDNGRHQIGVAWDGAQYVSVGISPEQAQMLETRRYTSHALCSMYGVPPPIIGDLRDSKYANAGEAIRFFVMMTVRSLVERIERSINTQVMKVRVPGKLISTFDDKTIFRITLDSLLRGDPKAQAETWKTYREIGAVSANDVLRDLDMNEIDGPEGDYRIVPGGYTRLDNIDNQGDRLSNTTNNSGTASNADNAAAYNREYLIAGLEEAAHEPKATVQGATLQSVEGNTGIDPNAIIRESIATIAEAAIARVNEITATQVGRWREQDPQVVATKLPEFFAKQCTRLQEALQPCDAMAEKIGEPSVSETIVFEYKAIVSALDETTVFDESLSQPSELCNYC